jgi:DNA-binding IclR family transcriptional regulator
VAETQGTEAAARVVDVLVLFTDGPRAWGVSAIARRLDLSKAVVHRILQTLVERGLLAADPDTRGYVLGPTAASLGARALRDSTLRATALPVLRGLQRETGETTTVSARVPGGRVYLDQVESTREIKMTVELGRRFPLHAGASSTCILAFLPVDERDAVLAGELPALTPRTPTDRAALRARLDDIRRTGWSRSGGERQHGAGSVAAPVFGVDGTAVGAISVCGPVDRFDDATSQRYAPLVVAAAREVSLGLGWAGPGS